MCHVHCFLSSTETKPPEPCSALSNNPGLVLTFFLIMATSTWMWLIIMVPVNRFCLFPVPVYLFTLREVYQLTKIRSALHITVLRHKTLIQFCLRIWWFQLHPPDGYFRLLSASHESINSYIIFTGNSAQPTVNPWASIIKMSMYQQSPINLLTAH